MIAMQALFDTNILIDYLNGIPAAADTLSRLRLLLANDTAQIIAIVIDIAAMDPPG
jgi:hypothetical protein